MLRATQHGQALKWKTGLVAALTIKRRTDVVGIFPNTAAIVRLVGALMLEQNDEWAVGRRYMTLEGLAAFSDPPQIRLPAVAA